MVRRDNFPRQTPSGGPEGRRQILDDELSTELQKPNSPAVESNIRSLHNEIKSILSQGQPESPTIRPPNKDRDQVMPVVVKQWGDSAVAARAAKDSYGNLGRIRETLQGEVNVGPGATFTQFMGRVASKAGMAGKDEIAKLSNTRVLMQQLAQEDLLAAQMLQGQGSVSNFEREAVARAAAGEIDKMTKAEILALTSALGKTRRLKIQGHKDLLAKRPQGMDESLVSAFDVEMPPEWPTDEAPQSPQPAGASRTGGRNIHNPVRW
jgi:hypothetical protein